MTESTASEQSADVVFAADGVSVYYGDFRAVRDVSLDVRAGEITAFIGPSGCGKSTLLRLLLTLPLLLLMLHPQ